MLKVKKRAQELFGYEYSNKEDLLLKNIQMLKSFSVEEYTLYKKWYEVNTNQNRLLHGKAENAKHYIWKPRDIFNVNSTIDDINNIYPKIVYVTHDSIYDEIWLIMRIFGHTMEFDINPGRFNRIIIIDEPTKKILGIVSIASDVTSISLRDKFIGWSKQNKFIDKKINNSAIANCIMALQPFGFNFLGGKLIASLVTTDEIRNMWKNNYNESLIGITTTSLYGSVSMYNSIPYWKRLGETDGKIIIKPDDNVYFEWIDFLTKTNKKLYESLIHTEQGKVKSSPKQNVLRLIFKQAGIKNVEHGFKRGLYYSMFYKNGNDFLCNKIPDSDLILRNIFERNINGILDWWKPKAIKRYQNLIDQKRINSNLLFYNDIIGKTWDYTKDAYLNDVGR